MVHGTARGASIALIALILLSLGTASANAEGVTNVQQNDGSTQMYKHVRIDVAGQTVRLHSPDRHDTLTVKTDACTYVNAMRRCLPYETSLRRDGTTHTIPLARGVVYYNASGSPQHLMHSSEQVAPNGVLVHLRTMRGTLISVTGTVDASK
jgi:hypothetical protein